MLLQRLATGATGVKQARYRRGPTRGSKALVRACAVYTQPVYSHCVYGRSLALAVQCETMHGVYEFRRGFCTLVLSLVQLKEREGEVAVLDQRLAAISSELAREREHLDKLERQEGVSTITHNLAHSSVGWLSIGKCNQAYSK